MDFEEDRQKLVDFVTSTRKFLADNVSWIQEKVTPELRDLLIRAWEEVQDQISTVRTTIAGIPNQFDILWTRIVEHGLTGAQLAMKLSLLGAAKGFLKIAKVRNSILESLVGAIGVGAAIKEFKDMLENAVDIYSLQMDSPAAT